MLGKDMTGQCCGKGMHSRLQLIQNAADHFTHCHQPAVLQLLLQLLSPVPGARSALKQVPKLALLSSSTGQAPPGTLPSVCSVLILGSAVPTQETHSAHGTTRGSKHSRDLAAAQLLCF